MSSLPAFLLRTVRDSDLAVLYEIQCEPEGHKMAAVKPRDEEAFLRHWREKILPNKAGMVRIIEVDGAVIGSIVSFEQDGRRIIGYWIAKKYWGRGVMTAALQQFVTAHEKHRPVSAFVAITNRGSYRVLEKCGFKQIGGATMASDHVEEFRMELQ